MRVRRWRFITVFYLILLAFFCLTGGMPPDPSEPKIFQILWPNIAHIPAYTILTYCLLRSFSPITAKIRIGIFAFALSYGALIEILQSFVPYRYPSVSDLFLNISGILLAFYLVQKRGLAAEFIKK